MRKKIPGKGQFVQISDRPRIKKSITFDPSNLEQMEKTRQGGESLSDKVNEAIAYYLQNHLTK